jgi:hypothetical protein
MGEAGRRRARNSYRTDQVGQRYFKVYARAFEDARRAAANA